ncbi:MULTISPECIES: phosphatidylinositol phosphate synthase [Arthrobacter]|uniref:Phosphatidylinositol phosphate synthase n=2 Tax=Arthrobacter TaxID=1663 RepID=A0ABU9KI87_9MICC|nr:CDP-alcohol phosphatidyltransferase family protein [Arthrobacter sp. YJM1]MDP5226083.1 CDP-alcohol phosphatidyltransferase family protein [Arthrobacter sp. YJM1]
MLNRRARALFTRLFTPVAKVLLKAGVTPDAVTVFGTLGAVVSAAVLYPMGQLFWGTVAVTLFIFSDVVDGIMARLSGRSGSWGGFLDATLDRFADGVLFGSVAFWFFTGGGNPYIGAASLTCLVLGSVVSYARAKAESLGFSCNVGIAERAERILALLLLTGLTGLGLPEVYLLVTLVLLALASLVTIAQRIGTVHRQASLNAK